MAISYTWNIVSLDTYPEKEGLNNVVFTIHWTLTGDDGEGHTGSTYGTSAVELDSNSTYTPYADLTKEQVVDWAKNNLGRITVAELESRIASIISEQINPTVESPALPWVYN